MSEIPETPAPPAPEPDNPLAEVRELILASHPDTVPELIAGDTIPDLIASIATARAAYTRVTDSMPPPVTVPAGGNIPMLVDADTLPTSEKIRRGLIAHRPQGATLHRKG